MSKSKRWERSEKFINSLIALYISGGKSISDMDMLRGTCQESCV